jgi:Glu-tRNA(Gln) amidotransferase subunit E-like FAD-binding protein
MTNKRKSIEELRDLSDEIDDSILAASDTEVSEELGSLGIDPEKVAAEMDAIVQDAKRMAGKSRLANAKEAVSAFRSNQPNTSHVDRSGLRSKFQKMLDRPGESDGLMMAARKGKQLSANDEEGALDDLAQLEALESKDPEAPKE